MNTKLTRALVAGTLSFALMAVGVSASAAPANPQPNGSKGSFYLWDGNTIAWTGEVPGTVYQPNSLLIASGSSTDIEVELNPADTRPVTGSEPFTGVWKFLSKKTTADLMGGTNTWNAYSEDAAAGPQGGTYLANMTLEGINKGPGGIADDIATGGSFWYGIAYTINNGVTTIGAVYREINIEAGTGNYTVGPVVEAVNEIATNTTLTSSATSAFVGDTVELTATVAEAEANAATFSGLVTFYDGDTAIGSQGVTEAQPSATITSPALTAGTHNLRAAFTPAVSDPAYAASEGTTSVVVSDAVQPTPPFDGTNSNGATGTIDGNRVVTITTATTEAQVYVYAYANSTLTSFGQRAVTAGAVTVTAPNNLSGDVQFVLAKADGTVLGWAQVAVPTSDKVDGNITAIVNADGKFADGKFILVDKSVKKDNVLSEGIVNANGLSESVGTLGEVEVIDQRYLSLKGWDLMTNVNAFTHANGTDTIAASALGVAPKLVGAQGAAQPDASGWAPVSLGAAQVAGSATYGSVFASQGAGSYTESATFDADLTFVAPAGSTKGRYSSTLTLTLVSK
ncbi:hypothetical protein GCM10025789_29530 [Tessaracoccus lubricantis]|uniref:Bacterial Ig-like domain-containing protein n=1 Tax=Tessaracoccus lubricantis TaxID=545543 RepID=A0ABP9FLZ6_9ACTN